MAPETGDDFAAPAAPAQNPGGVLPLGSERLAETARDYAKASSSQNTQRAYAADWRHYNAWCRRAKSPCPAPRPAGDRPLYRRLRLRRSGRRPQSEFGRARSSAACRPSPGISPSAAHRSIAKDRHIATVLAGIRRTHGAPPEQKEAVLPEDLLAMLATLDLGDLRGLRDRAILLIGFAGGLRRSEIVGLDRGARPDRGRRGWVEIFDEGLLLTLRGKTGWREVEIGRGSSEATCPSCALETWLKFARIGHGPLFRRSAAASGRRRPADRQARRPPGQARRPGRRRSRRSHRGRARGEILRAFAARRPRLLGRGRRALRAKTARPRLRRNDSALPAAARPVPRQSHQSRRPLRLRQSVPALLRRLVRHAPAAPISGATPRLKTTPQGVMIGVFEAVRPHDRPVNPAGANQPERVRRRVCAPSRSVGRLPAKLGSGAARRVMPDLRWPPSSPGLIPKRSPRRQLAERNSHRRVTLRNSVRRCH